MAYTTHDATVLAYGNLCLDADVASISTNATMKSGSFIESLLIENPYRSAVFASGSAFNYIEFTFNSLQAPTCWGVCRHNLAENPTGITEVEIRRWNGSTWVTQAGGAVAIPSRSWDFLLRFTPDGTSTQWRAYFNGTIDDVWLGQIFMGQHYVMGVDGTNTQNVRDGGFETTTKSNNTIVEAGSGALVNVNPSSRLTQDAKLSFEYMPPGQHQAVNEILSDNAGRIIGAIQPDQAPNIMPTLRPHWFGWSGAMKDKNRQGLTSDVVLQLKGI